MALHVELLGDSKKLYSGLGTKVILPTPSGIMEVLPHHAPFVVNLAPGIVSVQGEDKKPVKVHTAVGVAYKIEEDVTILIEEKQPNKLQ